MKSRFRHVLAAASCGRIVRFAVVLSLMLGLSLSGCFDELLAGEAVTVRTVSCAVVDPAGGRDVTLALHREKGVQRVPLGPLWDLAQVFVDAGFGDDRFHAAEAGLLEGSGPWTLARLQVSAESFPVLEDDDVTLHVLWVSSFEDDEHTLLLVAPGVVAVSEASAVAGAHRLERSEDFLARVLLLHAVGHALGAVNQGIPLNGTDTASQEGPAGHEPALDSVLNVGWDRVQTMPRTNATYTGYSAKVLDDWHAAARSVCP